MTYCVSVQYEDMMAMTRCHDHVVTENIWSVWSEPHIRTPAQFSELKIVRQKVRKFASIIASQQKRVNQY